MTYTASLSNGGALPSWLSFDGSTRTFSGTPLNENVGTSNIQVTATDNDGETVTDTFELEVINVNDTPTLETAIANRVATEDEAFSFTFSENTFNDVDAGDNLTYTATDADGNALPSWLSFDAETRTFSGTPLNENVGGLNILVTATDNDGASFSNTFELEVVNVNDTPTLETEIPDLTATEDEAFSFTLADNIFTDIDADDSLNYTATLADGSELPSWLTFNADIQTFNGTPTNDNVGSLNVLVTATDIEGETASDTFELTVENVNDAPTLETEIPNLAATEEEPFEFIVPETTFSDVDAGDSLNYIATLAGGDALPNWLNFDPITLTFSGTPRDEDVGTIAVEVTASDGEAAVSDIFELTVGNIGIGRAIIEYGRIENLTDKWQTINLTTSFTDTVLNSSINCRSMRLCALVSRR